MNKWVLNDLSKVKVIYYAVDFVLIGKSIFNCNNIPQESTSSRFM